MGHLPVHHNPTSSVPRGLTCLQITSFYADDGVTGTVALEQRPEGRRLLEDARRKAFDVVLVYKIDRLGRDPRLLLNAINDIEVAGAELRSMTEALDMSTPAGKFMRTILSGVAGLERDNIVQRSVEGTNRKARNGIWLGGVVPYGYRVDRQGRERRLEVNEQSVPGLGLSEADVIRLIFKLSAVDGKSCRYITEHLTSIGVPVSCLRDPQLSGQGRKKKPTTGVWWPERIRAILTSPTYKGLHRFGKRAKKSREVIERSVPAIVDAETWQKAQETLRRNFRFGVRNARHKYLLRGLMKCSSCGLTYLGTGGSISRGENRFYYKCSGKHSRLRLLGPGRPPCPSRPLRADIEDVVWRDLEGFLRDPGPVLQLLRDRMKEASCGSAEISREIVRWRIALQGKDVERNSILGLYRRGRIDATALDQQLDEIERERASLKLQLGELEGRLGQAESSEGHLDSAKGLLEELSRRLDEPLTWEIKRRLVELLVQDVRVEWVGEPGKEEPRVAVTYCFSLPAPSVEKRTVLSASARRARSSVRAGPARLP